MKSGKLLLALGLGTLSLAACTASGGSSSETDTSATDTGTSEGAADTGTSSTVIDPEYPTDWTEEENALISEVLGGHALPYYCFEAEGLEYSFSTDVYENMGISVDILILTVEGASLSTLGNYIDAQKSVYTDVTSQTNAPAGMRVLLASYDDMCSIQEQVAIYDEEGNYVTEGEGTGALQAVFFPTLSTDYWPAETICAYTRYFFGISSVPAPSEELDSGHYYSVSSSYDSSYNFYVTVTVTGDFTGYFDELLSAGYIEIEGVSATFHYVYSPEAGHELGVFVYNYSWFGGVTIIEFTYNYYRAAWPADDAIASLEGFTGYDYGELTPLPALEGADYYMFRDFGEEGFNIYCFGGDFVDEYLATIEETGDFEYRESEGLYYDLHGDYAFDITYYEAGEFTLLSIHNPYYDNTPTGSTEWPTEELAEVMASYSNGSAQIIPEPNSFDFCNFEDYGYFADLSFTEQDEDGNYISHVKSYGQQLLGAGWVYFPELSSIYHDDIYYDSSSRSVTITVQDFGSFGTNLTIQSFDVDQFYEQNATYSAIASEQYTVLHDAAF